MVAAGFPTTDRRAAGAIAEGAGAKVAALGEAAGDDECDGLDVMPLLRGETASFQGEQYSVQGLTLDIPGGTDVPVVVAALGPSMIKLTAEMADGTNTWMVGPKTMEEHIIPSFQAAGKSDPDIVAGMPIVLTTNIDDAKEKIAQNLTVYGQLPSYRAMLDREGAAGPADIAIVGDENQLRGQIKRFQDMGVTDFNAAIMDTEDGAYARTLEFLGIHVRNQLISWVKKICLEHIFEF